jgi:hypothetical protein
MTFSHGASCYWSALHYLLPSSLGLLTRWHFHRHRHSPGGSLSSSRKYKPPIESDPELRVCIQSWHLTEEKARTTSPCQPHLRPLAQMKALIAQRSFDDAIAMPADSLPAMRAKGKTSRFEAYSLAWGWAWLSASRICILACRLDGSPA